jgi:hypothetical protein
MVAGRYYNEGKAIDAVLRRIEARQECARSDGWSPDDSQDPDSQRRVDYVCKVGHLLYAFEHTGIEPFDNHIKMHKCNETFFDPIIKRFNGTRADQEWWTLSVPVNAASELKPSKFDRTRCALIAWVEANAAMVPLARFGDKYAGLDPGVTARDIPFPFSLRRWLIEGQSPLCGGFDIRPEFMSGWQAMEIDRQTRLKRACEDKFPKLARWKCDNGARTVLVLEENDISTTNTGLVTDAMSLVELGMSDTPDEIFLVSTYLEKVWSVSCLRREGKTYCDDNECFHGVDPMALTKLTAR